MRRYVRLSILISLLGGLALAHYVKPPASRDAKPATSGDVPDGEEYAVYAALLKEMFVRKETKQLVVKKHTLVDDLSVGDPALTAKFATLSQRTVDDFKSRNEQSYELNDQFNLGVKINFISREELDKLFPSPPREGAPDGWETFNQRFPTAYAIITLSRVGFNEDRSQALIFVAFGCGWLCGEGNYVFLTKKDRAWKIEAKSGTWIA
jgi:hypothetical protein